MDLLTTKAMLARLFGNIPEKDRPTESTVRKCRCTGQGLFAGLPFVKISGRVYYRRADVDAWAASFPAYRTTSELPPRAA